MYIELFIFVVLFAGLALWNKIQADKWQALCEQKDGEYKKLLNQKKSSEVRLGQISENLAPFLDAFKYNPKRAHFLGQPIDYIVFEDDKIVFLEIKSGMAQLNPVQKSIKKLIQDKKVVWDEMRINGQTTQTQTTVVPSDNGGTATGVYPAPEVQSDTNTDCQVQTVPSDMGRKTKD